jgi:hypothetical protein
MVRCADRMRSVPAIPVFSRSDARPCGWSNSALGRASASGRITRLRHNQFALPHAAGGNRHEERHRTAVRAAIAAQRACTGSVVSHDSAALLLGLSLLDGPPAQPRLTVPPHGTGDVAGALLHRASWGPEDVINVDGVPVTSPARTVVDLARSLPLHAAVVTADGALFRKLATPRQIADVRDRCSRWPGIRRARQALAAADGRAESPLESISRLSIVRDLRLPAPELQMVILSPYGWVIARCDFYWDEFGLAGEADGKLKYTDRSVLATEKDRQENLEDPGLVIARWGWREANQPPLLAAKLDRARARAKRRDARGESRGWQLRPTPPILIPS